MSGFMETHKELNAFSSSYLFLASFVLNPKSQRPKNLSLSLHCLEDKLFPKFSTSNMRRKSQEVVKCKIHSTGLPGTKSQLVHSDAL